MGLGLAVVNVLFVLFVLVAIPGVLLWAIRAEHRHHHRVIQPVVEPVAQAELVIDEPLAVEPVLA